MKPVNRFNRCTKEYRIYIYMYIYKPVFIYSFNIPCKYPIFVPLFDQNMDYSPAVSFCFVFTLCNLILKIQVETH